MFKHLLTFIAIAMLPLSLLANNDTPKAVTLCSGEKMSWEMYLLNKKMLSYKYDMEVESVEFVSFTPSMMNNQNGAWSSVVDMPIIAAAAAHLPDGKILTWSAKDKQVFGGDLGRTWTSIFDPSNNTATEALITNTGHDMFCPSATILPDDRIMVNGGSSSSTTSIFDPRTGGWSNEDDLNIARGYHAGLTHGSGATFVIGGSWSGDVGGKHSEVWTEKSGWYQLPGVLSEVITDNINSTQDQKQDDYFPWLFNAPNGQIFHAGPSNKMHWIDPTGAGSWTDAGTRSNSEYSTVGMALMYDVGKILTFGGSTTFENSTVGSKMAYTIDINNNTAVAAQTGTMSFGRAYGNAVVLPNGEVMAIGGQDVARIWKDEYAVLETEIWNPTTGQWRNVATMSVPRSYHSTALLMLDGRVFVAGSGLCSNNCGDTNHPDAQIYSPPYLFNNNGGLASRPAITSFPTETNWNTNMIVNTNTNVSSFVLHKLSTATHSTTNGQRRIPVTSSNIGNNQYSIQIPSRHILPPGSYMLFAMNSNGVPSVAKVIKIGDDINDCTPQSHANLGGSGLQGTYYNTQNFTNQVIQRTDPTINFNWGSSTPPAPGVALGTYSVIWEGNIRVPRDGFYTFFTSADDGVKLWVNGRLIVDNPTAYDDEEDAGFVELFAGQDHEIKIEYKQGSGGANMDLKWAGPGIDKAIVASQYLFPPNSGPCGTTDTPTATIATSNASCNNSNGAITFNFPDTGGRTSIEFSLDGGNSWETSVPDNSASKTYDGLSAGTYELFIRWGNDQCPTSLGSRTISSNTSNPGSACNDGNGNTNNDVIQSDGCTCAGTPSGGGGCPVVITSNNGSITMTGLTGTNTKIFNPNFQELWNCNPWNGDPCNNTETYNSGPGTFYVSANSNNCELFEAVVVGAGGGGCNDNDNDGVCAADDCNDNNANLPAPVGSSCNDGNGNTNNDVIQSDGCTCAGTPAGNNNCVAAYTVNGNSVTFTGLTNPINAAKIIYPNFTTYWECNTWTTGCGTSETINGIPAGDYFISLNTFDASWNPLCNIFESITIGGGGGCPDNDNDGICNADDCAPNNANLPAAVGSSCNDGNGNTTNDVIQSDGCTCAGTPSGGGGCPVVVTSNGGSITISGLAGTNAKIFNPNFQEQWGCNPWTGSPCNNTETYNSGPGTFYVSVNSNNCEVFQLVTVGGSGCADADNDGTCDADDCEPLNPSLPAPVGSACNDFNGGTSNDVIQSDGCTCAGTPSNAGGCNITYTTSGNAISVSGLNAPIVSVQVADASYTPIYQCGTFGTPCNASETINGLAAGEYVLIYQSYDAGWNQICDGFENISIGSNALVGNDKDALTIKSTIVKNENFLSTAKIGNVSLYPNPATDLLNINFKDIEGQEVVIEIYNTFGQLVYTKINTDVHELSDEVNLVDFKNGIYNMSITVDNQRMDTKLFVIAK